MGKEPNLLKEENQGNKIKTHTHTEEVMLGFPRPACLTLCNILTSIYIYIAI